MRSGFPFLLCFLKRATFQPANLPTFFTYLFSSHALPHSFAFTKNATLLFSGNSKLFRKNTGGRGALVPPRFSEYPDLNLLGPK